MLPGLWGHLSSWLGLDDAPRACCNVRGLGCPGSRLGLDLRPGVSPVVGVVMFALSSMHGARVLRPVHPRVTSLPLHGLEYRIEVQMIAEIHELLAQGTDVDP